MPITIDFQKIIDDLKAAGEDLFNSNDEEVKRVAEEYFTATENRLLLLAEKFASTDPNEHVDEDFVLARLTDEKDIALSQLESFEVKGLAVAQQAANKAIEILTGAITDILNQEP